jgi:hypothetical protein
MTAGEREQAGWAVSLGAAGAAASYSALRLGSFLVGEPDPSTVGPAAHSAYVWRCALSLWIGVTASVMVRRFVPAKSMQAARVSRAVAWAFGVAFVALILIP